MLSPSTTLTLRSEAQHSPLRSQQHKPSACLLLKLTGCFVCFEGLHLPWLPHRETHAVLVPRGRHRAGGDRHVGSSSWKSSSRGQTSAIPEDLLDEEWTDTASGAPAADQN